MVFKRLYQRWRDHANHWKGEIIFMVELMKHPEIPRKSKLLVFTLLSYIFSPLDLIPDFIPIFGYWDDILMIPITMKLVHKFTPHELITQVRETIEEREDVALFKGKGPKIAAFTVLLLWVGISWLTLRLLGLEGHIKISSNR